MGHFGIGAQRGKGMSRAVLSLGSNLGDRLAHLRAAVALLGGCVREVSGVYETPPWGDPDQPSYLNAVILVEDPAAVPHDWLERARACEAAEGRERDPARRFGPRTLDVDVITVHDADGRPVTSDDPELTLPHPRAHLRAFVLRPWLDLRSAGDLPGHGRPADLLAAPGLAADVAAVTSRPDLSLESMA
jgi:2-amino-4-hydroxy-6-hydroxymethyldihydropteridine diphosphokinase